MSSSVLRGKSRGAGRSLTPVRPNRGEVSFDGLVATIDKYAVNEIESCVSLPGTAQSGEVA